MKTKFWWLIVMLALMSASSAWADGVTVYTGYHDGLRSGGFFPNPWIGDTFNGQPILVPGGLGGGSDDGAILLVNNTGTPETISNITVDSFQNGASFSLWPTFTLAPGQAAILTATAGDNFDTSDQPIQCIPSGAIPEVHLTVGSTPETLDDTGQRLNTGGTDIAVCGSNSHFTGPNESIGWALIGTVAGQGNNISAPEPASLMLLGTGLLGICAIRRKFQA
jgi:PEP-CTERM motif